MDTEDRIKLFGMSHSLVEKELDKVEQKLKIELNRSEENDKDDIYYPQFDYALRQEAASMGKHYELFYCLEKNIRQLIAETLEANHGENWWERSIPEQVKKTVDQNIIKERDSGVTPRSEHEIDYSNFGELGDIVRANWDNFGAIFSSQKAFSRIMTNLNTLRSPIAHCTSLADDEIVRLQLTVKDWFRLME